MRTIFVKTNNERLPEFRLITKLIQDEDGKLTAVKEPVTEKANAHVQHVLKNYETLRNCYRLNLVKPSLKGKKLYFEMAEGKPLEGLLLEAFDKENKTEIKQLFALYLELLDGMIEKEKQPFIPSDEFRKVFGDWEIDEAQEIIKTPNMDLLFSNLFLKDRKFTLIDYEWVFDFPIPKSFIAWRAFHIFSKFHDLNLRDLGLNNIFKNKKTFLKLERNFNNYVYGKTWKYFLNSKVQKNRFKLGSCGQFLGKGKLQVRILLIRIKQLLRKLKLVS